MPRVSAIPIELSAEFRDTYIVEKHGSLQNNPELLNRISESLKVMQATTELAAIRGSEPKLELTSKPGLALEIEEVYFTNEPVQIQAALFNMEEPPGGLMVRVVPIKAAESAAIIELKLLQQDRVFVGTIEKLSPGAYRAEILAPNYSKPTPVHDVFLVI